MADAMLATGEKIVRSNPSGTEVMNEIAIFPKPSLVPESIALLTENVFGFNGLNNTFIAHYSLAGTEVTAFLSQRNSPQEAKELASGYHQMLVENGGVDTAMAAPIPDAWLVEILGTYELVFVHGNFIAGVHEAESKDVAEQLASALKNSLTGAEK
jgi:hypothetical protein